MGRTWVRAGPLCPPQGPEGQAGCGSPEVLCSSSVAWISEQEGLVPDK